MWAYCILSMWQHPPTRCEHPPLPDTGEAACRWHDMMATSPDMHPLSDSIMPHMYQTPAKCDKSLWDFVHITHIDLASSWGWWIKSTYLINSVNVPPHSHSALSHSHIIMEKHSLTTMHMKKQNIGHVEDWTYIRGPYQWYIIFSIIAKCHTRKSLLCGHLEYGKLLHKDHLAINSWESRVHFWQGPWAIGP